MAGGFSAKEEARQVVKTKCCFLVRVDRDGHSDMWYQVGQCCRLVKRREAGGRGTNIGVGLHFRFLF